MTRLEELEAENARLKADRRLSDEQNWRTLFGKVDEINTTCATCKAENKAVSDDVCELKGTVYGEKDAPGLKGHVADLRKESGLAKWSLGAAIVALLCALAGKIFGH